MPTGTGIYMIRTTILGETQQAFAARFDVGQSTISEAERGVPSRELALAVYKAHAEDLEAHGFTLLDLLEGRRRRWRAPRPDGAPAGRPCEVAP